MVEFGGSWIGNVRLVRIIAHRGCTVGEERWEGREGRVKWWVIGNGALLSFFFLELLLVVFWLYL